MEYDTLLEQIEKTLRHESAIDSRDEISLWEILLGKTAAAIRKLQLRIWELEGGGPCLKCGTVLSEQQTEIAGLRDEMKRSVQNLSILDIAARSDGMLPADYKTQKAEQQAEDETTEMTFEDELRALINKHSRENESDTPDHILRDYILQSLHAYEQTTIAREKWYGRKVGNGAAINTEKTNLTQTPK